MTEAGVAVNAAADAACGQAVPQALGAKAIGGQAIGAKAAATTQVAVASKAGGGVAAKAAGAKMAGAKVAGAKMAGAKMAGVKLAKVGVIKKLEGTAAFAALGNNPMWFDAMPTKAAAAQAVNNLSIDGIRMKATTLESILANSKAVSAEAVAAQPVPTMIAEPTQILAAKGVVTANGAVAGNAGGIQLEGLRRGAELKTMVAGRMVEVKGVGAGAGALGRGAELEGLRRGAELKTMVGGRMVEIKGAGVGAGAVGRGAELEGLRRGAELKTMVGGRMVEIKGAGVGAGALGRGAELEGMRLVAANNVAGAEGLKTAVATKGVTPMVVKGATAKGSVAAAGAAKAAATKTAAASTLFGGKGLSVTAGMGMGLGPLGPLLVLTALGAVALGIYGYRRKTRQHVMESEHASTRMSEPRLAKAPLNGA
jgi:hypothetical protein